LTVGLRWIVGQHSVAFINYLLSVALADGNEEVDADDDIEEKMDIDEVRVDPDKSLLACNRANEPM
jgi:hypothetical protein